MQKCATILGAAALVAGLGTQVAAQSASDVVATVNGVEITLGEMIIARSQLPSQYANLPDDVLFDGILQQLIQQQLFAESTTELPFAAQLAINLQDRNLRAEASIEEYLDEAVTEDRVVAAYEAEFADQAAGEEFNASHLLVATEEEALAALERVNAGEEFGDVARDVSTGPTGANGGNLGWFGEGQMVPTFEEAVKSLNAGEVSGPVQTQFGWHIVKLNEKRILDVPTLDDVRDQVVVSLQRVLLEERLEELRGAATIVEPEAGAFESSLISQIELLEQAAE